MKQIKVFVTDDHEVVIDGLTALLASEPDIKVIGKALNGEHLLQQLRQKTADVILMDIDMPGMNGIEVTKKVRHLYPDTKIIMLTMHNKREYVSQAISVGANGYMLKNSNKATLLDGIRKASMGGFFLPSDIAPPQIKESDDQPQLTEREIQIICLIAREHTSQEIGDMLFISSNTVETHRRNIFSKLGVRNVAGLVRYALQHELCDFEE